MNERDEFLDCLSQDLTKDARLIVCAFKGSPDEISPHHWRPRPLKRTTELTLSRKHNVYVTVASFGRAEDGTFRRRQSTFDAGQAVMFDDIGTKVNQAVVDVLRPTAIVETSPDNFQWWYKLRTPERDLNTFDALISAIIKQRLLGHDPGMAGVTRVGRVPGYTNGKPQHNGFITRLIKLNDNRYEIKDLIEAFNLKPVGEKRPARQVPSDIAQERVKEFFFLEKFASRHGVFARSKFDPSGWREVHCPWVHEHTNSADTGAAIREPHADNGYCGAFRCHHGSHINKHWKDFADWLSDEICEEVNNIEPHWGSN